VVQDTGFSEFLPTGCGLFAFSDADGAAAGIAAVESDYAAHQEAARSLAERHFSSDRVLRELLGQLGLG
jgi:hypothetical protein